MNINYTGHHVEVSEALKTITDEKFKRLERHFANITAANIIFNIENKTQIVEATLFVSKGELHARAESDDMYTAIDDLMDKLDRQLIKHKEKRRHH